MRALPFLLRAAIIAVSCLLAGGCAVEAAFIGPPFDYVPDYAAWPPPAPGAPLLTPGVPPPGWW